MIKYCHLILTVDVPKILANEDPRCFTNTEDLQHHFWGVQVLSAEKRRSLSSLMTFEQTVPSWTFHFLFLAGELSAGPSAHLWARRSAVHLQRLRPATGEQSGSLNPHLHHRKPPPTPHPTLLARNRISVFLAALQQPIDTRPIQKKKREKKTAV